jgi:hypothetical protein
MNQEKSSNDPDFWANTVCEVINGITKWTLLPEQEEAIKRSVRGWVIDIREDETQAIIREIERVAATSPTPPTANRIVAILHERLPRPL